MGKTREEQAEIITISTILMSSFVVMGKIDTYIPIIESTIQPAGGGSARDHITSIFRSGKDGLSEAGKHGIEHVKKFWSGKVSANEKTQTLSKVLLAFSSLICIIQIICIALGKRFHSLQLGSLIPFFVVLVLIGQVQTDHHRRGALFLAMIALLMYILCVMFTEQECDADDKEAKAKSHMSMALLVLSSIFLVFVVVAGILPMIRDFKEHTNRVNPEPNLEEEPQQEETEEEEENPVGDKEGARETENLKAEAEETEGTEETEQGDEE